MRDEKGRYVKNLNDSSKEESLNIYNQEKTNGANKMIFSFSYYFLIVPVILYGLYYLWTRIIVLFYPSRCIEYCSECNLNQCFNFYTCFCNSCLDCLRELGFVLYM